MPKRHIVEDVIKYQAEISILTFKMPPMLHHLRYVFFWHIATIHGCIFHLNYYPPVPDPGRPGGPLPLLKLVKIRWPPHRTTSLTSLQPPTPGQISGSASVCIYITLYESYFAC